MTKKPKMTGLEVVAMWIIEPNKLSHPKAIKVRDETLTEGPYAPPGMKVWTPRKNSKKWYYVYWGQSPEEAVKAHNVQWYQLIEKKKVEFEAETTRCYERMAIISDHKYEFV